MADQLKCYSIFCGEPYDAVESADGPYYRKEDVDLLLAEQMQLALSLGIPVKDLAERGVERVRGMKAAADIMLSNAQILRIQQVQATEDWSDTYRHSADDAWQAINDAHKSIVSRSSSGAWQAIESAPRDGSEILLLWVPESGDPHPVIAAWECRFHMHKARVIGCPNTPHCDMGWDYYGGQMTHWQPLPALPPANTKTGQAGEAGEEG